MVLDIKTLILINFIANLINAGAIAVIWRLNRGRFTGISLWLAGILCQAAGSAFILLRGMLPDFVSVVIANALLAGGTILIFKGLEQFTSSRSRQRYNIALLVVFACLMYYNLAYQPDILWREIWFSLVAVLLYAQMGWLLLRRVSPTLRGVTRFTGWIMSAYAAVSLARILFRAEFPLTGNEFFQSGIISGLAITAYVMLSLCLTISLIIMVNTLLIEAVRAQEEKFTTAFHSSPFAIIFVSLSDGKIFEVNDGFVKLTGFSSDETLGKTTFELNLWVREEDSHAVIRDTLRNRRIQGREIQIRKKSGELMTGLLSIDVILLNGQKCVLASIGDISELSQMKQKMQDLAMHDALTGLPNRTLLYDRAEIALANAGRNQRMLAVMSLDLDKFKIINDTLGHGVGDGVLVEVANRLKDSLRGIDTVARFGGDEFIVLLGEINHTADSIEVAERILESLRRPFFIEENRLLLSISIGIAHYPEQGATIEDLIKQSDQALYLVKENGGDQYRLTPPSPSV